MPRKVLITVRRGTSAELSKITLAEGELGFTIDTNKLFIGSKTGNVIITGAEPVGCMIKSVYDTNNDGIVDLANNANKLSGHNASEFILKGAITWSQLKGI